MFTIVLIDAEVKASLYVEGEFKLKKAGFSYFNLISLADEAEYHYYVVARGIKPIAWAEIEPYLDLMAEAEHVNLDRGNPNK